jgi:acyl-coenzyme A thioesterase PaaI-like protein
MAILRERLGDRVEDFVVPPPVFTGMGGEFLELNLDDGILAARFPVREWYLNPYRTVQGGMIAAAIDNTLGPLSMLVAPPNVTRRLEVIYSRPVTLDMGAIIVRARLIERNDRWLFFRADVLSPEGRRLVRSKAAHWIVDDGGLERGEEER